MKNPIFTLLLFTFIFLSIGLEAQKNYRTVRIEKAPHIDGNLTDKAWKQARWINEFVQHAPYEGKTPSQKTVFKIIYDDNFIYVAVRAYDDEPEKIEKQLSRRDNLNGDYIRIIFDSYFDKRTAFRFSVSAAGVKEDAVISNDGDERDNNWNPIWYVKTQIDKQGWTAELKIPLTQLRFSKAGEQKWGLQIERYIYRLQETNQWKLIAQDAGGYVSQFGLLTGMDDIDPKKEASLTPFVVASVDQFEKDAADPFKKDGYEAGLNAGLNGKFGITNNLTLDLAINPDFGQVEADPSQVNLTAYETFYDEKRPFFIEGSNILNFRLMPMGNFMADNLFYSRRIGRNPHHYPDLADDEYMDRPQNTTILGAMKLTGKTKHGWSIGVLESVTQKEFAKIDNGNNSKNVAVEPMTNYFISRIERDFNDGNTVVGGIITATNRQLDASQFNSLHREAYTGGFNFKHQWDDKTYIFQVNSVFSHVKGSTEAISETQLSSAHYFNRPDANHVYYDSTRQSLTGTGTSLMLGKTGNSNIVYALFLNVKSPELEMNDMGYQREADHMSELFWIQYRTLEPKGIFRRFSFNVNQWDVHDFNGTRLLTGGNYSIGMDFTNYWSVYYGMNGNILRMSNSALRGGPYLLLNPGMNHWISVNSDHRKKFRYSFGGNQFFAAKNAEDMYNVWTSISYRPHKMLDIQVFPRFTQRQNNLQYVATTEFNNNNEYIMGHIEQTTLRMSLRVNFSITPTLSIQYWGQPFISAGKYTDLKRITDARADKYENRFQSFTEEQINLVGDTYEIDQNQDNTTDYSFDKPDFNVMDFISNLVIRWEYIPGSSVYLVWTQNRSEYLDKVIFNFSQNTGDLFNVSPYNVFLVKATYRFSLN